METFTLELLHAHQRSHERDRLEGQSGADVLRAYDEFDWLVEGKKANELQILSPTISVIRADDHLVWVSVVEDSGKLDFLSAYHFPGLVRKGFFRWREEPAEVVLDRTHGMTQDQGRKVIEMFVSGDLDELKAFYTV